MSCSLICLNLKILVIITKCYLDTQHKGLVIWISEISNQSRLDARFCCHTFSIICKIVRVWSYVMAVSVMSVWCQCDLWWDMVLRCGVQWSHVIHTTVADSRSETTRHCPILIHCCISNISYCTNTFIIMLYSNQMCFIIN